MRRTLVLPVALSTVALWLAACGGSASPTADHPPAQVPPAAAVPTTAMPRAALEQCLSSRLLHPICPTRVPRSLTPERYDLGDGCANAAHITLASPRCSWPVWSYEVFVPLRIETPDARVRAWDGRGWFSPSYAPMFPPPYHVHVDIQATAGSPPPAISAPSFTGAERARSVADVLLDPSRARAVSFGRVRWFGHRTLLAPQPGPALPHVIATLKTIVGTTLAATHG